MESIQSYPLILQVKRGSEKSNNLAKVIRQDMAEPGLDLHALYKPEFFLLLLLSGNVKAQGSAHSK